MRRRAALIVVSAVIAILLGISFLVNVTGRALAWLLSWGASPA